MVKTDISKIEITEPGGYVIYSLVNLDNLKRYIGRTKNPEQRIKKHFVDLKSGKHSNSFLNQDCHCSFGYEILEEGIPKCQGKDKERTYITKYKTYQEEFGYNVKDHCVSTILNPHPEKEESPKVYFEEMTFNCQKLKRLRIEKGLTQEELANLMGLNNRVSVCNMEHEPWAVTLPTINRIAKALGVSPLSLIKVEEKEEEVNAEGISNQAR